MTGGEQLLTGWGRTCPSVARVREPRDTADIEQAIADVGPRGLLARGLGRSYGDAAQSGGATVLDQYQRWRRSALFFPSPCLKGHFVAVVCRRIKAQDGLACHHPFADKVFKCRHFNGLHRQLFGHFAR